MLCPVPGIGPAPDLTHSRIALLSFPTLLVSLSPSKGLLIANSCARRRLGGGGVFFAHHLGVTADAADRDLGLVTIDVLPDNVLLDIFDFCLDRVQNAVLDRTMQLQWQRLARVCRGWKDVVSQSTRRLDLHVLCTE